MKNFKCGDIVTQKNTKIGGRKSDNADVRVAVVLFETDKNVDGRKLVCTCPLTGNPKSAKAHPEYYYHHPYLLLRNYRSSFVKVNDVHVYEEKDIFTTGLSVTKDDMQGVYDKLVALGENENDRYLEIASSLSFQLAKMKDESKIIKNGKLRERSNYKIEQSKKYRKNLGKA